jgi:antitoxin (DNA-binding transcriptional repressor) of toxin-antitoxin stability system
MADDVIHISEAEAASDFAGLLARVRAGAEVVIESGKLLVAVIHPPAPPRRTISECIALLPEDSTVVIDADFRQGCRSSHREPSRTARTALMGLILDSSVLITAERQGAERTADARRHRPHSRKYRHRHIRRHTDRTGPRCGPCRRSAMKGKSGSSSSMNRLRPCQFIRSR